MKDYDMNRAVGLMMAALMIFSFNLALYAQDAKEILENVKKKYDSIDDAELKFSQSTKFAMTKKEEAFKGTLFLKKKNKYRIELDKRTIVTDGKTVWSYAASNKQVLIDNFKENERSLTPDKVLSGAPKNYTPSLEGSEKVGKTQTRILKLVPKSDDSMVGTMRLWVDESTSLIKKVEIVDDNGKETVYIVNDARINIGIPDSRFTFQVPSGVETVDLR